MANEEHLAILRKGVTAWNAWRGDNLDVRPDLHRADLNGADLNGADLRKVYLNGADLHRAHFNGADLRWADLNLVDLRWADLSNANLVGARLLEANLLEANLSETDLLEANFRWANLNGANLRDASLVLTNLSGANLRGADLSGANLVGTDLSGADLSGANLSGAHIRWTVFANVDLTTARGLDIVKHDGPSTIGLDTIYKSHGNIPEVFLRGCGVPHTFIEYMASLVGKPIEFYSCFISYSTKNQDFADRLYADLQAKGVRCWFAPEDVQGGKKLHEQIEQAVRLYEKLLLVLSEHSMSSEWVKTEIYHARQQEIKSERRKLFPVSLVPFETIRSWKAFDADSGKDMAREVREYFVPDFLNWKDHDAYQKAFDRLLRDLKVEPS